MSNTLDLFKQYVPILDEVYKNEATTSDFEMSSEMVQAGANANEIIVPKLDMDGLGDYDRNSGYTQGDVKLTLETVKYNYERGRKFTVDAIDNEETALIAFGRLAGEFIRTKVVPEVDAVRYAQYASTADATVKSENLTDGASVLAAILTAMTAMDEAEVPTTDRHLRITPTLLNSVKALDTTKSREALEGFASIKTVPQTRFYSAVTLYDGKTTGEEKGGYIKATDAKDLNFEILHKPAVLQYTKHAKIKVITPEANQTHDGWIFGYRIYGLNDTYENKVAGIYVSTKV